MSQQSKASRRRTRKPGSLGRDFTPLYEPVMRTAAVTTLSASDFRIYVVITTLCKPWLNGAVPLARSVLEAFGIVNHRAVTRALAELQRRDLIVCTRKARPRHAAMYGVAHLPLNADAMAKAGARTPARRGAMAPTPPPCEAEFSAALGGRERVHFEAESGQKGVDSAAQGGRIPPISASNSASLGGQSKNLPFGEGDMNAAHDDTLTALIDRVRAAGGTLAVNHRGLRLRWWNGMHADLDGEVRLRHRDLCAFLRRAAGA